MAAVLKTEFGDETTGSATVINAETSALSRHSAGGPRNGRFEKTGHSRESRKPSNYDPKVAKKLTNSTL
jgi:hypothetical protein